MELSVQEFEGMQSKVHLWFNEHAELAGFKNWGHAEEPLFTLKEFETQAVKSGFVIAHRCNWVWLDGVYRLDKR